MTDSERELVCEALSKGLLEVQSVSPDTGEIRWSLVSDVLQHRTGHIRAFKVYTDLGVVHTTEDHSLFRKTVEGRLVAVKAQDLTAGDCICGVLDDLLWESVVLAVQETDPLEISYDLSVPGDENFVLANGVLAHNSYSIGGVSLDINKASEYSSMAQSLASEMDKAKETKKETVKFIRGLQQPRFGMGVRSAFGPNVGRGILSPRSFVG